jgi:diguanylate cyclase (GGDEF)-like protein
MDWLLFFDLNIFAILLLVALLIVIIAKKELLSTKGRIFQSIVFTTILMLIIEIFSWVFDGEAGSLYRGFNIFFNFLVTSFSTVVVSLWASYIDFIIYEDIQRLKRRLFYLPTTILLVVMGIINLFYPILFTVSNDNVYQRLPLIWTGTVIAFFIYIYVLIMVIRNVKKLNTNVLYGVMMFLTLPIIAALIQLLQFGLLLIWPTTAVAVVFSYLIFETTSSSRDYLTGARTRMRAEETIRILLNRKRRFAVALIDLDDFKIINDTYGHRVGDRVLIHMTKGLQEIFSNKAIVARYGGDEFLIVLESVSKEDMDVHRKLMEKWLRENRNEILHHIRFSMGSVSSSSIQSATIESIITAADNEMYLDKARNKNFKRRKTD